MIVDYSGNFKTAVYGASIVVLKNGNVHNLVETNFEGNYFYKRIVS